MAKRKTTSDWEKIEHEYCSTDDSVREIADRHSISEGAIRKRAKADDWRRPVRSAQKREQVRTFVPPPLPSDPEAPVDAAAVADDGRALVARMLDELDVVTSRRGELEDLIEAVTEGDDDDDRRIALERSISLKTRADTMKTLALALKTLNEASAPQGKKAAQQERANEIASRFRGVGPPSLKVV